MARTHFGFRGRWLVLTLIVANNIKVTYNQYYFIEGRRPVFLIDESRQSPAESIESDSQTSSEKMYSSRSLEDFGSSETVAVQYVEEGKPFPPGDHPDLERAEGGIKDKYKFSHEDESVESSQLNPQISSDESSEKNLRGDPGNLFEGDEDGRLPEPRLFFNAWPIRLEYKESWKGGPKKVQQQRTQSHPFVPTSLVDPKFYDSKFYYKFVKKRNKKIKKAKKWQKLSSLIQFKYMKYLKELEQLAPDDASIYDSDSYDSRILKKSKSKKKKQKAHKNQIAYKYQSDHKYQNAQQYENDDNERYKTAEAILASL